jgi:hypothetical protein
MVYASIPAAQYEHDVELATEASRPTAQEVQLLAPEPEYWENTKYMVKLKRSEYQQDQE